MVGAWLTEFAALSRVAGRTLMQRESLGTGLEAIRYGGNGVWLIYPRISRISRHLEPSGWRKLTSQLPGNGHKDKCTGH